MNNRRNALASIAGFLAVAVTSAATQTSAPKITPIISVRRALMYLDKPGTPEYSVYLGYIYGALALGNNSMFCLPETPAPQVLAKVAKELLLEIPEEKQDVLESADVIALALSRVRALKCVGV